MNTVRRAATIMLARDHKGTLEILLLKRNKALAFAGGLWVFPGGKIEAIEIEEGKDELAAARLAAVRETKEEADVDISPENLIFFRHWTTPVIEPRRYATWFFFAHANHVNSDVTIDDSEIKAHCWINPQVALDRVEQGELHMLPPTIMSLQLIRKCQSAEDVEALLRDEEPIFTLPVLNVDGTTLITMYEGDAGYDNGKSETIGARHRLTVNMEKGGFHFEYENCKDHKPINGGMHL